jgi:hypothetical protein
MAQYMRTPDERAHPDGDGFVVEVPAKNRTVPLDVNSSPECSSRVWSRRW